MLALLSMLVGATGPLVAVLFARFFAERPQGADRHQRGRHDDAALLKIVVFGLAGFAFWEWVPLVAAMILSGFLGTVYGTALLERMPEETFRKWFRIGITLLALDLLRRGLTACERSSPRRSSAVEAERRRRSAATRQTAQNRAARRSRAGSARRSPP